MADRILLIGMMERGRAPSAGSWPTGGVGLHRLGRPVDQHGQTVKEIFAEEGEAAFRVEEAKALRRRD